MSSNYMFEYGKEEVLNMQQSLLVINRIFSSITYILPIGKNKDCWLVDCGDVEKIINQGWNILGVLLTHVHTDHIYGLNKLLEFKSTIAIYTNAEGLIYLKNPRLNLSHFHEDVEDFVISKPENVNVIENEGLLKLSDNFYVNVLFTPGHDPSCLSFRVGNMLFTGDAYIPGVKVVVTFPRSNKSLAYESFNRLCRLEKEGLTILPGHYVQ